MSVLLGTTKHGKELMVSCKCGIDEGIRIGIDKEDPGCYAFLTYMSGNFYREQDGAFRCLIEKCKKIWKIIRNKDFYYSEVLMNKEDFETFKRYVNEIGE